MRIPRDRPRVREPAQPVAMRLAQQRRRAVRAVDVQPEPALVTERTDRLELVERAGRRGARGGDDGHHAPLLRGERVERHRERLGVHAPVARRDDDGVVQAEPELAHGARDGVVRVLAADDDGRIRADAVRPRVGDRGGARGEQRGERRLGAAARERAARRRAEAGELAHPAHDAVLEHRRHRRHLGHGERLIERGDQRLRPDRRGQRRRDLMAGVARMIEPVHVGEHVVAQSSDDGLERLRVERDRLVEPLGDLVRRARRAHRALAIARVGEIVRGERGEVGGALEATCRARGARGSRVAGLHGGNV